MRQKLLKNSVEVQIARNRLPALDGLRGLAALGVVLFHSGFNVQLLGFFPLQIIYNAFAVGPNSVQVLFVLSGFLMAYLYQNVKSPLAFLQKRYLRIIPALSVVVIYIWLTKIFIKDLVWYQKVPIFIAAVLLYLFVWRGARKLLGKYKLGRKIFFLFVLVQIVTATILTIFIPRITHNETVPINQLFRDLTVLLANVTLTTPFSQHQILLDSVFWSLFLEILFYILFPFLVAPLIHFCKKSGWSITIVVILIIGKILLDLDAALSPLNSFLEINIARSNGFVVGVLVGTLYFSKSVTFDRIKRFVERRTVSVVILFLFFAMQWGDTVLSGHNKQPIEIMNIYYLISSWVIGLTIVAAISKTFINKIFSLRIFTFLGMISYSMYLFHHSVFDWMAQLFDPIKEQLGVNIFLGLLYVFVCLFVVIVSSYFVFKLIESLYFLEKKNIQEVIRNTSVTRLPGVLRNKRVKIVAATSVTLVIIIFIYTAIFPFPFLVEQKTFDPTINKARHIVLTHKNFDVPITSSYQNLSIVAMHLWYGESATKTIDNRKRPAILKFSLIDSKNTIVSHSEREAYKVEGSPDFLFGFVPQPDSINSKYIIRLNTIGGNSHDYVEINTKKPITLLYSPEGSKIMTVLNVIINRILIVFTLPEALFAIVSILGISILMIRFERK